jgi:hypothetical protein
MVLVGDVHSVEVYGAVVASIATRASRAVLAGLVVGDRGFLEDIALFEPALVGVEYALGARPIIVATLATAAAEVVITDALGLRRIFR